MQSYLKYAKYVKCFDLLYFTTSLIYEPWLTLGHMCLFEGFITCMKEWGSQSNTKLLRKVVRLVLSWPVTELVRKFKGLCAAKKHKNETLFKTYCSAVRNWFWKQNGKIFNKCSKNNNYFLSPKAFCDNTVEEVNVSFGKHCLFVKLAFLKAKFSIICDVWA